MKAFHKLLKGCLIYKLNRLDIYGKYYESIHLYLGAKEWFSVVNGQICQKKARILQVPNLKFLLFLIYINNTSESFTTHVKSFTDYASVFHDFTASSVSLNNPLLKVFHWN